MEARSASIFVGADGQARLHPPTRSHSCEHPSPKSVWTLFIQTAKTQESTNESAKALGFPAHGPPPHGAAHFRSGPVLVPDTGRRGFAASDRTARCQAMAGFSGRHCNRARGHHVYIQERRRRHRDLRLEGPLSSYPGFDRACRAADPVGPSRNLQRAPRSSGAADVDRDRGPALLRHRCSMTSPAFTSSAARVARDRNSTCPFPRRRRVRRRRVVSTPS